MADLPYIQEALEVKITGQDSTGNTVNYTSASANGDLFVRDVINTASQYQALSLSTTAVEAKGGASRLSARKLLIITPTNGKIYWGTSTAVTTTTGTPIYSGQSLSLSFTDNVPVYIIAAQTTDVRIVEGS